MTTPQPPVQQIATDQSGLFSMPWVLYFASLTRFLAKPIIYAVAYSANWTDYGAIYQPGIYYKDLSNVVHLSGLIKKSTALALPETATTLPSGFRPAAQVYFSTSVGSGIGTIIIYPTGVVQIVSGATYFSLDGISFQAA